MKIITCENAAGASLSFPAGFSDDSDFVLQDATGVLEAKADLFTSEGALSDGAVWQGSRMQKRNIVLTIRDRPNSDHAALRLRLFDLFRFKQKGSLTFTREDGTSRFIEYVVESVTTDVKKRSHSYQVSLMCPSPFFLSSTEEMETLGGVSGGFTFQHIFTEAGEIFGTKGTSRSVYVENEGASNEIGLTITLSAVNGTVTNPKVYRLESGEKIDLGDSEDPLVLLPGESIIITTGRGNKRILSEDGENLAGYLSEDSDFMQIESGGNTFTVGADKGASYLMAVFRWRYAYEGV